jgi:hypothetical protein
VVLVERRGCRVLGVDDDGEDGRVRANGAFDGVEQKRGPEAAPTMLTINCEPPNSATGITG